MKKLVTKIEPDQVTALIAFIGADPSVSEERVAEALDAIPEFTGPDLAAARQWVEGWRKGLSAMGYTPSESFADARAHAIDIGPDDSSKIRSIVDAMDRYFALHPMPYLVERAISELSVEWNALVGAGLPDPEDFAAAKQMVADYDRAFARIEEIQADIAILEDML